MNQKQNTSDQQNHQAGQESEAEAAQRRAGVADKSSEEATSRTKAGTDEGAGGGAKQKQQH